MGMIFSAHDFGVARIRIFHPVSRVRFLIPTIWAVCLCLCIPPHSRGVIFNTRIIWEVCFSLHTPARIMDVIFSTQDLILIEIVSTSLYHRHDF